MCFYNLYINYLRGRENPWHSQDDEMKEWYRTAVAKYSSRGWWKPVNAESPGPVYPGADVFAVTPLRHRRRLVVNIVALNAVLPSSSSEIVRTEEVVTSQAIVQPQQAPPESPAPVRQFIFFREIYVFLQNGVKIRETVDGNPNFGNSAASHEIG